MACSLGLLNPSILLPMHLPAFIFTAFFSCILQVQAFDNRNITLRGSLQNSWVMFETEKTGRVAFIGGSITEMDGYRPMIMESLKKRFPQTKFKFINAGISSTCSTTGAFRLERDVISQGPIDLLFLEFAVNDEQDARHSRPSCIRGFEGIIRNFRSRFPMGDLVVTYFVNPAMLARLNNGETPVSISAHESILQKYEISRIHLARELASQIKLGLMSWESFGGTHPKPAGNRLCADMHRELFDSAWSSQPPSSMQAHSMPIKPIDPNSFFNGRFLSPGTIPLINGWSFSEPAWNEIIGKKRNRFLNRPLLHANAPADPLSFSFDGRAIGAFLLAGPDAGIIEFQIDEEIKGEVDLFHHHSKNLHYPRTVVFSHDLPPGRHKMSILPGNSEQGGSAVRILEFCIN